MSLFQRIFIESLQQDNFALYAFSVQLQLPLQALVLSEIPFRIFVSFDTRKLAPRPIIIN